MVVTLASLTKNKAFTFDFVKCLHDLPEQLQDVIFCKLPFTSITAARCVCKHWRTKLRSQNFLVMYRECRTRPREQWIMASNKSGAGGYAMFSIQDRKWVDTSLALPPSLLPRNSTLALFGSCVGLWCIGVSLGPELSKLVLCDPIAARIFKEIPLPWKAHREDWNFWGIASLDGYRRDRMVVTVASISNNKVFAFNTQFSHWSVCDSGRYVCSWPATSLPFFAVRDERIVMKVRRFDPEKSGNPWLDLMDVVVSLGVRSRRSGIFVCNGETYAMVGEFYNDKTVLVVHKLNDADGKWDYYSFKVAGVCDEVEILSNGADKIWVVCCGNPDNPVVIIAFDVSSEEWTMNQGIFGPIRNLDKRFNGLPEQLQDAIFCKLPFTSITVARRVCKQWRTKLRSQNFLVMYRECKTRPREQWIMASSKSSDGGYAMFSVQDRKWVDTSLALPPSLLPQGTAISLALFGSCMGLWCIGVSLHCKLSKLVLCDPIAGRIFKEIPLPWTANNEEWNFWGIASLDGYTRDRMVVVVASIPKNELFTFNTQFSHWSVRDVPKHYLCSWPVTTLPFFAVRDYCAPKIRVRGFDPEKRGNPWLDVMDLAVPLRVDGHLRWTTSGIFVCKGDIYAMVVEFHEGEIVLSVHKLNDADGKWDYQSFKVAGACEEVEICSNGEDKIWVFDEGKIIEYDVRSKEWTMDNEIFKDFQIIDKVLFFEV
ncbi:hypothetical protein SELMODRAFT_410749 [Selaginella moellendorffii]|uniref:F-box domain-containing protein n=1 Tax=Selaginella moellendorffii TaxID=88036 RepID=D8RFR5_SELML|nr:hypothetical protein SELMODRAFT_410749 [Selaginella moellendorffii]